MQIRRSLIALALSLSSVAVLAQTPSYRTPAAAAAPTVIPALVPYSGTAIATDGKPLSGEAHITFLIFKEEQGGEPLWTESQMTAVDSTGHYKVQLGASNPNGLPSDLFATGEARWLEVQIAGQQPEPRILLASVPYALKAADAATLGGLPASAFALAGSKTAIANAAPAAITPDGATAVTTTGGTANNLAKFSGANTIVNSILYDNGTDVGVGTTTPTATLDVNGTALVTGTLGVGGASTLSGPAVLTPMATATAAQGHSSHSLTFESSAYNSSSSSVVQPRFELEAEAHKNDTATPTATLNLLSSTTASAPAETGFSFNADGTINFAPGQNFGSTVNVTNGISIDGRLFDTGSASNGNAFLGFSTGNPNNSGFDNIGIGALTLQNDSNGSWNIAIGTQALFDNSTGFGNIALGIEALYNNTTGDSNIAIGANAGSTLDATAVTGSDNTAVGDSTYFSTGSLENATAIGAGAIVSQSNSLVLGYTAIGNPGEYYVNVGIGTDTPRSILEAVESNSGGLGPVLTLTNSGGGANAESALDFNTYVPSTSAYYNPAARIVALDVGQYADDLYFQSNALGGFINNGLKTNMVVKATGQVGIGTTTPDSLLTVNGSADKPGGGSWGTYSDMRLKTVNGSFSSGLDQVMRIRPIRYRYNPGNGMGIRDMDEHVGVVAQEVQRVIPEAVTENSKGYLLVNNDPILWSMVNAIQEQQREIAAQQKLIRAQSQMVKSLTAEVRETRKTLRQVKELAASGQGTMVASK